MKFLLVGQAGCYNRGCEAILRTTIAMLNKEFANPEIVVSSIDFENDKLIDFGENVSLIPASSNNQWIRFKREWLYRQFFRLLGQNKQKELYYSPLYYDLKTADVVISIGGDNYSMDYNFPEYFLNLNDVVKSFHKKLMVWGASIGPFPRDYNFEIIRNNLQKVDLIAARESHTVNYLKNELNIGNSVKLVADPAFILEKKPVDLLGLIPEEYRKNVLGFNISPILERYSNECDSNDIIKTAASFLNCLIKEKNFFVLLIPHVMSPNHLNNDFYFMEHVYELIENKAMVGRVPAEYNAQQMKYVISQCRFFIGARTHATIASLSSGVPTLCVGYSLKAKGINHDLFGHFDYLISIEELRSDNLHKKFGNIIRHENEIKNILVNKLPFVKEMAYKNVLYLKNLCFDNLGILNER